VATQDLLRTFAMTFGAVFFAELGDKTQLATMALAGGAGSTKARWIVFAGAACALVATSAIGVLGGGLLARAVRPATIERVAGGLFVAVGLWMLLRAKG
jgi:putative Ca2+/H+ antiporter (TMEM165/GDT1 family)